MRFKCYEAIGVAIGEASNVQAVDHLVEDVLSWRFQYPDIQGATDEWGHDGRTRPPAQDPLLDADHRIEPGALRTPAPRRTTWLRPASALHRRHPPSLPARRHALFVNADIGPIYFVAKQLLRTLPVYFNEVGAEGELATVSTDVDEIRRPPRPARALPAQAASRRVVEPHGRLQPRGGAALTGRRSTPPPSSPSSRPTPWPPCASEQSPAARTRLCLPGSGAGAAGRR